MFGLPKTCILTIWLEKSSGFYDSEKRNYHVVTENDKIKKRIKDLLKGNESAGDHRKIAKADHQGMFSVNRASEVDVSL
jgi:hypothetical protein